MWNTSAVWKAGCNYVWMDFLILDIGYVGKQRTGVVCSSDRYGKFFTFDLIFSTDSENNKLTLNSNVTNQISSGAWLVCGPRQMAVWKSLKCSIITFTSLNVARKACSKRCMLKSGNNNSQSYYRSNNDIYFLRNFFIN